MVESLAKIDPANPDVNKVLNRVMSEDRWPGIRTKAIRILNNGK